MFDKNDAVVTKNKMNLADFYSYMPVEYSTAFLDALASRKTQAHKLKQCHITHSFGEGQKIWK